jgi:hypothetical protein
MTNTYDTMTDVQLASLPANGKIQREAFGAPGNRTPEQAARFERCRNYSRTRQDREIGAAVLRSAVRS